MAIKIPLPDSFQSQFGVVDLGQLHVGVCRVDIAPYDNLQFSSDGFILGEAEISLTGTELNVHAGTPQALVAAFETMSAGHVKFPAAEVTTPNLMDQLMGQSPSQYTNNNNPQTITLTTNVTGSSHTMTLTASAATLTSSATLTVAGTFHAGDILHAIINGVDVAYTVLSGDTNATGAAASLATAILANTSVGSYFTAVASTGVITLTLIAGNPLVPVGATYTSQIPNSFGTYVDIGTRNINQIISVVQGVTTLTVNTDYLVNRIFGTIALVNGGAGVTGTALTVTASVNPSLKQATYGGLMATRYFKIQVAAQNPVLDANGNPIWEVVTLFKNKPSKKFVKKFSPTALDVLDMEFDAVAQLYNAQGSWIGRYDVQNQQPFADTTHSA